MGEWQSKQELIELLCTLVQYPSITGSDAEITFASHLYSMLGEKEYFKNHPEYLKLHPLKDGRQLLTALVKREHVSNTVLLLSHFDVVAVDDYGSLKDLAFRPKELTAELNARLNDLPKLVQQDITSGDWLFGRGSMDMKAGLAVQLSMLEKAMEGYFSGNILLVTVPDEEVNSFGMISALPVINKIKHDEGLTYLACMNGEPMFSTYPGDSNHYLYTGSIGKILPGFFCYGKETHVGEPFAGVNANLMNSYLARELELNESFIEVVRDEVTPPPVSLMQRDLKHEYSVQTPTTAVSMYNVLYLQQSIELLTRMLLNAGERASEEITKHINEKMNYYADCNPSFDKPNLDVNVFLFEELYEIAVNQFGEEEVKRRQQLLINQSEEEDRDITTLLVQDLASLCKELAPMIILFYSPPFYPAVSSHTDPLIERIVNCVQTFVKEQFKLSIKEIEFFPGLSDLSYIGPMYSNEKITSLLKNMPLHKNGYTFPIDEMKKITMPVINIGPLGKDPHQWTERVELTYSFDYLPQILANTINEMFLTTS